MNKESVVVRIEWCVNEESVVVVLGTELSDV